MANNQPTPVPDRPLTNEAPSRGAFRTLTVGFDTHDARVIAFHFFIAALQGGLVQLKIENFGVYTTQVVLGINILLEIIRRFLV